MVALLCKLCNGATAQHCDVAHYLCLCGCTLGLRNCATMQPKKEVMRNYLTKQICAVVHIAQLRKHEIKI